MLRLYNLSFKYDKLTWEKKISSLIKQTAEWNLRSDNNLLWEDSNRLLAKLMGADASYLIRLVDDTTAKVEQSSNNFLEGLIVHPGPVKKLLDQCDDKIILWKEIPIHEKYDLHELFADFTSAVLICLEDSGNEAMLLYCWNAPQQWTDSFKEFAQIAKLRMNELLWQSNKQLALNNVSTRFHAILETIPESVVFIDNGGKEGWVNSKAAKMLQLPTSGEQPPMILSAAMAQLRNKTHNANEINEEAHQLFSSPNGTIKNWKWHFPEPEKLILNVSCVPIISTHLKGRLWVFEDVTSIYLTNEQLKEANGKLAEETKRADKDNKAKSEFLANMSHEIRTPMNGVIGMTSLLMHTALSFEQREFVETIRISGETLITLINDILDFSKIESGNLELETRPLSVANVVEESFDLLSLSASKKHLELLYFIEPDVPEHILGDVTRLRQILVNLVSNGIKFTDKGQVYVYVRLVMLLGGKAQLEFMVQDSGIGIPAEKFGRLFQNFSQVDSSTTRKYGGTGLGLAICKKLVDLMKGEIWVESNVGTGASFYFTILAEPFVKTDNVKVPIPLPIKKGKKKVIIVDDNSINLTILKKQFEYWGIDADTEQDVHEAIAAIQQNHYDLALLDMVMPLLDGIQTARRLKSIVGTKNVPLILISSAYSFLSLSDDDRALFVDVLNKPIKYSHLHKITNTILGVAPLAIPAQHEPVVKPVQVKAGVAILVAEDNVFNQMVIKTILATLGYQADIVANGLEALKAIHNQTYQLVFMDMQMPEMDGLEAAARICAELKNPPIIIALTANNSVEDQALCQQAGMSDFIQKPFTLEDIKAVLIKWEKVWMEKRDIITDIAYSSQFFNDNVY